jgi:tetratricopeptide (TPR) repeat protein
MRAPFDSLLACGAALVAMEAVLVAAYVYDPNRYLFDLDGSGTAWTWLSSLQLAAIACAFLVAYRAERRTVRSRLRSTLRRQPQLVWSWVPLALVFFGLSADEVVSLHERVASWVIRLLPASLPMRDLLPWELVLAPAVIAVFVTLFALTYSRLSSSRPLLALACIALALLATAFVVDAALKAYLRGRIGVVVKEWSQLLAETCLLLAFAGYAAMVSGRREVMARTVPPRAIAAMTIGFLVLMVVPPIGARILEPAYFYWHMAENSESWGNHERAMWAYERALESEPENPRLWHALGLAALRAEEYARSEEAFGRETKLQPRDAVAFSFIGMTAFLQGALDRAQAAYERALAIRPKFATAHRNLGWVHERRGDDAAAEREYRLALAANDEMADVHRSLGDLLARTGRAAEATEHWRRSLELEPYQMGAAMLAARVAEASAVTSPDR